MSRTLCAITALLAAVALSGTASAERMRVDRDPSRGTVTITLGEEGRAAKPTSSTKPNLSRQSDVFPWRSVGGDPCNPRAGCTLEWALQQAARYNGWPQLVINQMLHEVRTRPAITMYISSGWEGWMTWGDKTRKFRAKTRADWPQGQTEAASHWHVSHGDKNFNLIKVHKCGNWGGWESVLRRYEPPPTPEAPPLGRLPIVACPENEQETRR